MIVDFLRVDVQRLGQAPQRLASNDNMIRQLRWIVGCGDCSTRFTSMPGDGEFLSLLASLYASFVPSCMHARIDALFSQYLDAGTNRVGI